MGGGHTLDVGLVDDRLVIGPVGRPVVLPVEVRVDDHRDHRVSQRVERGHRVLGRGLVLRKWFKHSRFRVRCAVGAGILGAGILRSRILGPPESSAPVSPPVSVSSAPVASASGAWSSNSESASSTAASGDSSVSSGVGRGIGEERGVAVEVAVKSLAVRVEKEFARVTPQAAGGIVGAVDAETVELSGHHIRQIAVPTIAVDLFEADAPFLALAVDEAQLDGFGDLGEQREVRPPRTVVGCAERVRGCPARRGIGAGSGSTSASA